MPCKYFVMNPTTGAYVTEAGQATSTRDAAVSFDTQEEAMAFCKKFYLVRAFAIRQYDAEHDISFIENSEVATLTDSDKLHEPEQEE